VFCTGGTTLAQPLLSDALWPRIEPLLPPLKPRRFRFPGRKPLTHRQALTGILFVLRTGIRWNDLPGEMGCGSGSACRKRLPEWQQLGVWDDRHHLRLEERQQAGTINGSRAAVDSSFARALGGGEDTGPNPTARGRKGSKHHAVVDAQGLPLAATVTAANVPDVKELLEVVAAIEPVAGHVGRPRQRPEEL
jgi:transposase